MLKSPSPTITPTIVPLLYFFFDSGLLATVGLKSEQQQYVTLRHPWGDMEKKKNSPACIPGFAVMADISGP